MISVASPPLSRHCNTNSLLHTGANPRFGRGRQDDDDSARPYGGGPQHQPTRPVDREKNESELALNIKKATSPEETAPSMWT